MTERIGIIGAMEEEVTTLIAALEDRAEQTIGRVVYHTGKLGGKDVVVAKCGVGKVNAALTAAEMIRTFFATVLINTGVAGALEGSLSPEDAVIATDLVQHDYDTSPLGDEPGFVSGPETVRFPTDPAVTQAAVDAARALGMRVLQGTVASGDQFISSQAQKKRIKRLFGAYACEMEGAAIAHACYLFGVKCAVIRTISDRADGEAQIDFPTFATHAAALNAEIVKRVVASL
ncbi:MAG: 5'-methylthioadenosine/adenosylhomocysteine nucleosidase [Clostridia bacterium]|nr:5'-methylthioadenosine/adenosylhomocysteine nucleosidase [Clostridia bacterium]